jgi:hypothetical protein
MSKHHDEHELHFEGTQHHGVQYEDRDLGARGIIVFLVVLGVTGLALCLMVWGYFDYYAKHMRPAVRIPSLQAEGTPTGTEATPTARFPKPSLQTDDVADMAIVRQSTNERLNSYGYIDKQGGIVHIPIDQAMDILAKQGLPTRQAPVQGAVAPGKAAQGNAALGPVADFGSGDDTVAGAGGGVRPENQR